MSADVQSRVESFLAANPAESPSVPTADAQEIVRGLQSRLAELQEQIETLRTAQAKSEATELALYESEQKFRSVVENAAEAINVLDLATGRYEFLSPRQVEITGFTEDEIRGISAQEALDRVHPDDRVISASQQKALMDGRVDKIRTEYRWRVKSGEYRWFSDSRSFIRDTEGRPVALVGVSMDITDRKRTEEALRELNATLEHRVAQRTSDLQTNLEAIRHLHQLGLWGGRDRSLTQILKKILDAAIAITGADFGNIQLLDPVTGDLNIVAHRGFPTWWIEFWNGVTKGKGACGTALKEGRRVIVEDVERSPIFRGKPALDIQRRAGVRAVQSTPLVSRSGKILGMFSTHYKTPHTPDARILSLLDILARQAADMIERKRLEAEIQEIAEHERQQIGRDLHDGLGQTVTAIRYLASAAHSELARRSAPETKELAKIVAQAQNASRQAHEMARGLFAGDLGRAGGLGPALKDWAAATEDLFGVTCRFTGPAKAAITDPNAARQLYRIAQEAVSNAIKHSHGTQIQIRLRKSPRGFSLTIKDNGSGIQRRKLHQKGLGLRLMQYRADIIGAKLQVDSTRGRGTTVCCEWPTRTQAVK